MRKSGIPVFEDIWVIRVVEGKQHGLLWICVFAWLNVESVSSEIGLQSTAWQVHSPAHHDVFGLKVDPQAIDSVEEHTHVLLLFSLVVHDGRGVLVGNGELFHGADNGTTETPGEFGEGCPCEEEVLLGVGEESGEEGE